MSIYTNLFLSISVGNGQAAKYYGLFVVLEQKEHFHNAHRTAVSKNQNRNNGTFIHLLIEISIVSVRF